MAWVKVVKSFVWSEVIQLNCFQIIGASLLQPVEWHMRKRTSDIYDERAVLLEEKPSQTEETGIFLKKSYVILYKWLIIFPPPSIRNRDTENVEEWYYAISKRDDGPQLTEGYNIRQFNIRYITCLHSIYKFLNDFSLFFASKYYLLRFLNDLKALITIIYSKRQNYHKEIRPCVCQY